MARLFPAVIVSGARQVGKTTLLRELDHSVAYLSLDMIENLDAARKEPMRFLSAQTLPLIIDEIQYAPDLFRSVKVLVDKKRTEKGRFFLTGSQRFLMMQGVDESLAGRVGVAEMLGLSLREIEGAAFFQPFVPTEAYLRDRRTTVQRTGAGNLWDLIVRGDLPELYADSVWEHMSDVITYYDSYIDTYLRRDVSNLAHVGDIAAFNRFMGCVAATHGQQLNKADLAVKCGISVATVGRWLSVLEASNIIYLLKPLYANSIKRLVKTPKLYFLNSGLAARFSRINSGVELEQDFRAGAFFEGFVLAEILKSHINANGSLPEIYYYRDSNRNEIDFVLAEGNKLYPLEAKKASVARSADTTRFAQLDYLVDYVRQPGAVICDCAEPLPLQDENWAIPAHYL